MENFGIFIRSVQDDPTIIEKCQNLLDSIQSDTKILHVLRDEVRGGLKVVFDTNSRVAQLLQKKNLDLTSTIHALTTALIVHEAFPNNEEEFKNSIRNKMAAKVLEIKKVPISAKYPEIGTGKWIIILDVPEIEDLHEFTAMGLPKTMFLKLSNSNSKLKVEFYCRLCQKAGHVQSGCLGLDSPTPSSINVGQNSLKTSSPSKKSVHFLGTSSTSTIPNDRFFQKTPPKPIQPSGFRIRDIAEERSGSVLKSLAVKRDIKAFKVELGTEEVKRSLNSLMEIKKEKHGTDGEQPSLNTQFEVKKEKYDREVHPPIALPNFNVHADFSGNRGQVESLNDFLSSAGCSTAAASSTSKDKDGLEIIYESPKDLRSGYFQNQTEIENQVTTTNSKRRLSDEDDNSNPEPQARKTLRILPVVIPDGIRQIISDLPDKVLDIRQLEAFFSHAKKKSRPLEIAEVYTSDVEGFKRQLVEISRKYYMSPNVGSNADIQFVKMLQNVLKRFENAPPIPKRVSMTQQLGFQQSF